jgi:hypothetical protein
MGFPIYSPAIQQAIERGLIRREDVFPPAAISTPRCPSTPAKRKPVPDVRTQSRGSWSITLTLACRVVSEANRRDHWSVARRRKEIQFEALTKALRGAELLNHVPPPPLVVMWVHVGKAMMDDDNLRRAFKGLWDSPARWIGLDDGDERVRWDYGQQRGEPGVRVSIAGK